MKTAIAVLVLLVPLILGCGASATFSLLPGQTYIVHNEYPRMVHIVSEYPVKISGSGCSSAWAVELNMHCNMGDLSISDNRPAVLVWAHANKVTVSEGAY
jgi:hypothetical protein